MKQFTRFISDHGVLKLLLKMKQKLLFYFLLFISAFANGQAVSWELSTQPGDQANNFPTVQGTDFGFCNLNRSPSIETALGAGSMNSDLWFEDGTPTTLAGAIAENRYYEFTISTINCIFFNPTTIKIVIASSADGPNTATLRCSSDGFTTNIGTVLVETSPDVFTFSETISPSSQSITYRLYGYGGAAGGGTPSPSGTMRIGSSQTAADNDLEFFATTTFINVTTVTDIVVTAGDFVPASAFTANVPGATFDWSRTPESIGLGATSGTGNIPAFTASNNTGSPVTSTVTVHATEGTCSSVDMIYSITVNPALCTITVDFFGSPSSCNDNGTTLFN